MTELSRKNSHFRPRNNHGTDFIIFFYGEVADNCQLFPGVPEIIPDSTPDRAVWILRLSGGPRY